MVVFWRSCVCGVAIREGDVILVADMCKDRTVHYIRYPSDVDLPPGAAINITSAGYSFKVWDHPAL